jgi:hypothetical protein
VKGADLGVFLCLGSFTPYFVVFLGQVSFFELNNDGRHCPATEDLPYFVEDANVFGQKMAQCPKRK